MGIKGGLRDNRLSRVLRLSGELESLGPVKGRREADLADLVRVDLDLCEQILWNFVEVKRTYALQRGLCSSIGFAGLGGSTYYTYASAIALEELAKAATAEAYPLHHCRCV